MTTLDKLPGRFNKGTGVLPMIHAKAAPHARLALELMATFGVIDEVYKIWFFNYRHMRHDPSMPLSLHSWGIACDINSKENFAWYPAGKEQEIQPFSREWYQKYPRGLSKTAVLCMKKAGFPLGRRLAQLPRSHALRAPRLMRNATVAVPASASAVTRGRAACRALMPGTTPHPSSSLYVLHTLTGTT